MKKIRLVGGIIFIIIALIFFYFLIGQIILWDVSGIIIATTGGLFFLALGVLIFKASSTFLKYLFIILGLLIILLSIIMWLLGRWTKSMGVD